ncbi:hypothetical protein AGLY_000004, partial [Aphis glycines]
VPIISTRYELSNPDLVDIKSSDSIEVDLEEFTELQHTIKTDERKFALLFTTPLQNSLDFRLSCLYLVDIPKLFFKKTFNFNHMTPSIRIYRSDYQKKNRTILDKSMNNIIPTARATNHHSPITTYSRQVVDGRGPARHSADGVKRASPIPFVGGKNGRRWHSGRRPQCVFLFHRARCANSRRPRDSVSPRRSLLRRRRRVPFHKKISDSVETSALRPTAALLLLAARRVRSRSPFYLYNIYYVSSLLVYYHYWHYYCIVVGTRTSIGSIYFFYFFSPRHADVQTAASLCARKSRIYSEFRWRTSTTFIPHLATTTTINSFGTCWYYLTSVRDDNARPRSAISARFSSPELETETIGSILYTRYIYHPNNNNNNNHVQQ